MEDEEQAVGRDGAKEIWEALLRGGFISEDGKIQATFDPLKPDLTLDLPDAHKDVEHAVIELLSSYQIERHVRRARDEGPNRLRKEVALTPEFQELWARIKPRTTYRVEFETDELIHSASHAIRNMEHIEPARLHLASGMLYVDKAGVQAHGLSALRETVEYHGPLPDLLAYLQSETELTRSTLVRILKRIPAPGRLLRQSPGLHGHRRQATEACPSSPSG